ncbi:hypothetical protein AGMMS50284_2070 [Clostridia bacterium]|nr:hypothetical protein AGMMS50284_2070 [Clostridia bacterium]
MSEVNNVFAERLYALRKEKNVKQSELADAIGCSRVAITNYEKGTRMPDCDTLRKIAEVFDVQTDYLLGSTQNATVENISIANQYGFSDAVISKLKDSKTAQRIADLLIASNDFDECIATFKAAELASTAPDPKLIYSNYIEKLSVKSPESENFFLNVSEIIEKMVYSDLSFKKGKQMLDLLTEDIMTEQERTAFFTGVNEYILRLIQLTVQYDERIYKIGEDLKVKLSKNVLFNHILADEVTKILQIKSFDSRKQVKEQITSNK